ncbi:cell division protein ZipA C-terminal FtsZ-binding domain-containing protein [Azoarcus sp. KH32C]|uniref:cell division protein ZipA C-terminal FtsZ-binding domain-containing protein n=1 Tax=Azoarcus sp. KH32C TaxID=748247 RepID=UPI000238616A|nr:cell division protein ZipA C-terminal FtsZ-binding domain-containing protein [Azoarcus sp. KH32C]BAL25107.1 ZipA-like protein [Azoarcus sp. KH32C]
MDSELQIGLAALGVAAVVSIVGYNKWQERKHRREAELAFKSEHRDVLLEPNEGGASADERLEPSVVRGERSGHAAVRDPGLRKATPRPPEQVDSRVDCIIRIESIEPLEAPRLWAAQSEQLMGISKPVRWYGFDDAQNVWRELNAHSAGAYHWFCAAMQMVDRRGPISESDLMHFSGGVQRVAEAFFAVPAEVPSSGETLRNAAELDRFCAGVDVQIGINIVSSGQPFAGTKIRALAESNGLVIGNDGAFHACDEDGNTLFTLSNMEANIFAADTMRNIATHGMTLLIDVPRVPNGVFAFERMMRQASQMADALQGVVVDDNRSPLGPEAANMIRNQIQHFQAQMASGSMAAGGQLAMRLFSD